MGNENNDGKRMVKPESIARKRNRLKRLVIGFALREGLRYVVGNLHEYVGPLQAWAEEFWRSAEHWLDVVLEFLSNLW